MIISAAKVPRTTSVLSAGGAVALLSCSKSRPLLSVEFYLVTNTRYAASRFCLCALPPLARLGSALDEGTKA